MTKQELLEQINGCLPYDLQVRVKINGKYQTLTVKYYNVSEWLSRNIYVKPIMRPLSDLTRPCLEGGKIPIVELAKTVRPENWFLNHDMADSGRMYFAFDGHSFWLEDSQENTEWCNQLQLFQQLYKWHFWLGDQSEFGKSIIDINTLSNE